MQENENADYQEFLDKLAEYFSRQFESSMYYTNIIIGGGYAAFFGVWGIIKDLLTNFDKVYSVLFMSASLLLFIIWEIIKMIYSSISFNKIGKALQKTSDTFFQKMKQQEKTELFMMQLWPWFLIPTIVSGIVGIYFLFPSLIKFVLN
jgi:Sec-independent protein secretion pathway component TatC